MKILHQINKVLVWSTLALYLTVIGGVLMQILLGAFQIILAIVIVVKYYPLISKDLRKSFNIYLIMVAAFGLIWMVTAVSFDSLPRYEYLPIILIILLFAASFGIAVYQMFVTNKINNYLQEKAFEL